LLQWSGRAEEACVTRLRFLSLLLAMAVVPLAARAQPAYPNGAVTIVVPYAAGGITDLLARLVAEKLAPRLGVPVVAENRTGAGGSIAAQAVARAKPDGQTLLMHSSAILPVVLSLPGSSFEPMKELAPVGFVAGLPSILTVNPAVPATTMPELLAWLRANPGRANCGNLGEGAGDHQGCLAIEKVSGSRIAHVTYRGLPPLNVDLIGGAIQMNIGAVPVQLPLVREGKLRMLAVATTQRLPNLPDVPTLLESGVPYDALAKNAVFAPAGTPPAILARLNSEIAAIMAEPAVRTRIEALGAIPGPGDVESLRIAFQKDWDRARTALGK
jgi:tripartite-type tricarboxylate transporter receptor subunit TctC